MTRKLSALEFTAYRRWVLTCLPLLFAGDTDFWVRFARIRSRLARTPDPIGSRFSWERPFLASPAVMGTISRMRLCTAYGVSRDRLRKYERTGMLFDSAPGAEGYRPHDLKRLQWFLFFVEELGIRASGMCALFSLEGPRSLFERLAFAAPPDVPVHRSRPTPSLEEKKSVHLPDPVKDQHRCATFGSDRQLAPLRRSVPGPGFSPPFHSGTLVSPEPNGIDPGSLTSLSQDSPKIARVAEQDFQGLPPARILALRELLHDMGNKLHVISGRAERLRRKIPDNELVEKNTSIILAQAQEAAHALGRARSLLTEDPAHSSQLEKGA